MEDAGTACEVGGRLEVRTLTLADLSMLVVGFALAFCLPRIWRMDGPMTIGNVIAPGWVNALFIVQEAAMKGGLILAPVIVARRVRYGGLPGPGEWLGMLMGLPLLGSHLHMAGWMKGFARWYLVDFWTGLGYPVPPLLHARFPGRGFAFGDHYYYGYEGFPVGFRPGQEGVIWGRFAAVVFLVLAAVLGLGWKRMPGWARTVLLGLAALTWTAGVMRLLFPVVGRVVEAVGGWIGLPSRMILSIDEGLLRLPEGVLVGVILLMTLREMRRGTIRAWSWTGWGGFTTGLLALAAGVCIDGFTDFLSQAPLGVRPCFLGVAVLLGWLVVRKVGEGRTGAGGLRTTGSWESARPAKPAA